MGNKKQKKIKFEQTFKNVKQGDVLQVKGEWSGCDDRFDIVGDGEIKYVGDQEGVNAMIERIYAIGYESRNKQRDFDPMGSDEVCEAKTQIDDMKRALQEVVSDDYSEGVVGARSKNLLIGLCNDKIIEWPNQDKTWGSDDEYKPLENLLKKWDELDVEHKQFVFRVEVCGSGKYAAEPRYGAITGIALWKKCEQLGFIECVGSCSWIVTSEFKQVKCKLMGCGG